MTRQQLLATLFQIVGRIHQVASLQQDVLSKGPDLLFVGGHFSEYQRLGEAVIRRSDLRMIGATNQPADRLCRACFTGSYPVPLPDDGRMGKGVLELELPLGASPPGRATGERHPQRHATLLDVPVDVDGVATSAGGGAHEALLRP